MPADICPCGRRIVQPATGRRRQRCETCSPTKPRNQIVPIPVTPDAPAAGHPLVEVVRAALERAGKDETPDGAAAIFAAEMLAAGGATAAAAASLLKEMRAAAGEALKGVALEDDVVDDLKARRAARRGA